MYIYNIYKYRCSMTYTYTSDYYEYNPMYTMSITPCILHLWVTYTRGCEYMIFKCSKL